MQNLYYMHWWMNVQSKMEENHASFLIETKRNWKLHAAVDRKSDPVQYRYARLTWCWVQAFQDHETIPNSWLLHTCPPMRRCLLMTNLLINQQNDCAYVPRSQVKQHCPERLFSVWSIQHDTVTACYGNGLCWYLLHICQVIKQHWWS